MSEYYLTEQELDVLRDAFVALRDNLILLRCFINACVCSTVDLPDFNHDDMLRILRDMQEPMCDQAFEINNILSAASTRSASVTKECLR